MNQGAWNYPILARGFMMIDMWTQRTVFSSTHMWWVWGKGRHQLKNWNVTTEKHAAIRTLVEPLLQRTGRKDGKNGDILGIGISTTEHTELPLAIWCYMLVGYMVFTGVRLSFSTRRKPLEFVSFRFLPCVAPRPANVDGTHGNTHGMSNF